MSKIKVRYMCVYPSEIGTGVNVVFKDSKDQAFDLFQELWFDGKISGPDDFHVEPVGYEGGGC